MLDDVVNLSENRAWCLKDIAPDVKGDRRTPFVAPAYFVCPRLGIGAISWFNGVLRNPA